MDDRARKAYRAWLRQQVQAEGAGFLVVDMPNLLAGQAQPVKDLITDMAACSYACRTCYRG